MASAALTLSVLKDHQVRSSTLHGVISTVAMDFEPDATRSSCGRSPVFGCVPEAERITEPDVEGEQTLTVEEFP